LVLHEHGFGDHGMRAAGAGESTDGRQQMQKKDSPIAHSTVLPRATTRAENALELTGID
jgi:hypothetical protein